MDEQTPQGVTILQFSPIKVYFFMVHKPNENLLAQVIASSIDECLVQLEKQFNGNKYGVTTMGNWDGQMMADGLAQRGVYASKTGVLDRLGK